ncbi:hypothetical protein AOQ84DRAFT_410867, partial [Glonium stellatum]
VENCPKGYPNLAAFLDSDENFTVYRRFGYLQARLLLDKQDDMRKLEEKLDEMDREDEGIQSKRLITRDLKQQEAESRRELFKAIEEKFCEYAHILTAAQTLMAFNRPATSDYQSVANYIYNKKPVVEDEQTWIYCKEDMITLRKGRAHAWLDTGIERLLSYAICIALSLVTRARRHEVLAAAAAYCAVLVVFLGNVGP